GDLGQRDLDSALGEGQVPPGAAGLFVPACTAEGSYEDVQCFAGECWCVDSGGKELPGSRVRGGPPRCPPGSAGRDADSARGEHPPAALSLLADTRRSAQPLPRALLRLQ
uniref:Thyroglobulin type-1 domain-containing protein n=1 Tax=Oryctolagus cuniculus TaxID=9986 RepID=A0A5F9DQ88_RABIT